LNKTPRKTLFLLGFAQLTQNPTLSAIFIAEREVNRILRLLYGVLAGQQESF
jgi:hypothetical protein